MTPHVNCMYTNTFLGWLDSQRTGRLLSGPPLTTVAAGSSVAVWSSNLCALQMHRGTGTNTPSPSGSEVMFAYPRGFGTCSSV